MKETYTRAEVKQLVREILENDPTPQSQSEHHRSQASEMREFRDNYRSLARTAHLKHWKPRVSAHMRVMADLFHDAAADHDKAANAHDTAHPDAPELTKKADEAGKHALYMLYYPAHKHDPKFDSLRR